MTEQAKLSLELLAFVPEDEQEEFRQKYASARRVLEVLKKVIERKEKEKRIGKVTDYDKPAWPYFAADKEGYKRALNEIKQLL